MKEELSVERFTQANIMRHVVIPQTTPNARIASVNKSFSKMVLLLVFICVCSRALAQSYHLSFNTNATSPACPVIRDYIASNKAITTVTNDTTTAFMASIYGYIERVSPSRFVIGTGEGYTSPGVIINPGKTMLTSSQLASAIGNFEINNLSGDQIDLSTIQDGNTIRLPEGTYNICFYALLNQQVFLSPPNPIVGCGMFTVASTQVLNDLLVNTIARSPVNPVINIAIANNGISSTIQSKNTLGCNTQIPVKLFGQIERISPSQFTIALNPQYNLQPPVNVNQLPTMLTPIQLRSAFGDFDDNNLVTTGINLADIKDVNNNIRMPDGNYRICFYARYIDSDGGLAGTASDPNLGCSNLFSISCTPVNGVQINTVARPQFNPVISQAISAGGINTTMQTSSQPLCNTQVKLFGKIERISPSPFSISLNENYQQQAAILLNPGAPVQLNIGQQADAFGNFNETNLVVEGIELASIKDATNSIKLPDGNYRICFYARYVNLDGTIGGNASDANLGCASFTICYQAGGAPQFTQPVSNLDINSDIGVVQPASPVVFTWTPPQSTCGLPTGGYTYDFEIRELLANQTVNDAINNPYVFRKTLLPSTTFLLDTNLNKNVLEEGKRYAIRVRAVSTNPNSPVEIDNNGYSRIEAFQYGGKLITQNDNFRETEDYYIPFKERRSNFWSDIYAAYRNHARGDTLVPIEEYIAFALTQNGTAYSLDAIELFLDLNPELAQAKKVKISYTPNLPMFPAVPVNDQVNFDKEHQVNLEPDKFKENKFLKYLDTLNNYKQKIPDNAVKMINDLVNHLNNVKTQVDSVDRVTADLINKVLSELLYELHLYSNGLNKNQYNQLQGLVAVLLELTALSPDGTAFLYLYPSKKRSSLSSYQSNISDRKRILSLINNAKINDAGTEHLLSNIIKQLLPFDVIVYRDSKGTSSTPVLDAPDLKRTYRIFYALPNLYNHKFPEINSNSTTRLASTVQVSLPSNTVFTFWATNMVNHKITKAKDVDLRGVLSEANKLLPNLKKPSIVIKVD